jgi:GNAT superfamily N-acetyltransferase
VKLRENGRVRVEINPDGVREPHLAALRECFPGWGDEAKYAWYFEPRESLPAPDVLVLRDRGEIVAGTGLTYRTMRTADEMEIGVAVLTGSFTLPPFRGQGLFARVVEESRIQIRRRACDALLGFVRANNASRKTLEGAGARMLETRYFQAPEEPRAAGESLWSRTSADPDVAQDLWRRAADMGRHQLRFHYSTPASFAAQVIDREPKPTIWQAGPGDVAILEDDGNATLLPGRERDLETFPRLIRALDRVARSLGRRLKIFATSPLLIGACENAGLEGSAGFLSILADSALGETATPCMILGADRA